MLQQTLQILNIFEFLLNRSDSPFGIALTAETIDPVLKLGKGGRVRK